MGNAQSPSIDPRFTSATRSFTQNELENLKSLFVSLAAQSQSNCKFISPSVFKAYFRIPGSLGQRMFDLVTQKRNDQELTFEDLVITKGIYEKGSRDEIEEFIYQLLDVTGDGVWGRSICAVSGIVSDTDMLCSGILKEDITLVSNLTQERLRSCKTNTTKDS